MTIKEVLKSCETPLNESLSDKIKAGFKKFKVGAKYALKVGALLAALTTAFSTLSGAQIMSWDKDTANRRIEILKQDLRSAKNTYLQWEEKAKDFDLSGVSPEIQSKVKNQIMAASDVIDNAQKVLAQEGKILKGANPLSDNSLKAVKNEIDKVMTSIKITDKVMREAEQEKYNNADVQEYNKLKDIPVYEPQTGWKAKAIQNNRK